jgi:DNA-binding protein HU-beta
MKSAQVFVSKPREFKYSRAVSTYSPLQISAKIKAGQNMRNIQPARPMPVSAKKSAKAKVETITLRHLAMTLAEHHSVPKKQANAMLMDMVVGIAKHLKKGARVRLNGLGILQVRKRPARMGRNPATGEAIKIKASKKIAFRAAKELKQAI